jgi:polar amino acid transport system substrate-binding protein
MPKGEIQVMDISPHDSEALAPTGALRATINLSNPILARQDAGQPPTGVSVGLARALATRLEVSLELFVFDGAAKAVDAVSNARADIGFFAIDRLRSQGIQFTTPYVLFEGCYLVREGSSFHTHEDVEQRGVSVVVGKGSAYDLYLTRTLQRGRACTCCDIARRCRCVPRRWTRRRGGREATVAL